MPTGSTFRLTPGMILRILADVVLLQLALIAGLTVSAFKLIILDRAATSISDVDDLFFSYSQSYLSTAWPLTGVCIVVFCFFGFYTYGQYYQGRYKALIVTQAVSVGYLIFALSGQLFPGQAHILDRTRLGFTLAWVFSIVALVGARIWSQFWRTVIHPEHEVYAKGGKSSKNRVLVIGGAGYIGSALLPKLLNDGYHVRLLDVLLFGDEPICSVSSHPNLEIIRGDFRHVENVVQAMRDVQSVIHLGAIVGDPACSLDEDLTIDINLSATRMIAELAKESGVERFIFASTCSVYGACDETLDERSQVQPVSLYGHTKLASEQVLRDMADDQFAPTVVRFATIYGLSGRTRFDLVVNLLAAKARIDGEITVFGGDQWRPFVHVDDAAQAVATILNAPRQLVANQVFNVGSNEQNYTISEIGQLVHDQVVTATLTCNEDETDKRNYRVDFSKIRNHLGFTPRWTVEQGIEQVLEAIANGDVTDYRDSMYSNVKFLVESGTQELARDNWARELIRDLSSQ